MWFNFLLYVYFLFTFSNVHCQVYTWREFNGTVPEDAIVGGQTSDGENVYIGQVAVDNQLLVAEIFDGEEEVEVVYDEHRTRNLTSEIKILCGPERSVFWYMTDAGHLHARLIGKRAVIGGYESTRDSPERFSYIGRSSYYNDVKIGRITAWSMKEADLYFHHNGKVLITPVYEVLLHNDQNRGNFMQHSFFKKQPGRRRRFRNRNLNHSVGLNL